MIVLVKHARKNDWSNVFSYKNCSTTLVANITRSGSRNTGLTPEDEKELEEALGYKEGTLSKTSEFWHTYSIKIGADGKKLNTNNPYDKLIYMVLKSHKRVANGFDTLTPDKDFVLVNQELEAISKNKANRRKREAIVEYSKLTPDQMRKCLKILGINADNSSSEVVESTLYEVIENRPDEFFLKWVDNNNKDIEYMIKQAISKNILRKNKSIYYYGTDIIGASLDDTIAYFKDKNNNDIKLAVMSALEIKETV